MEFRLLGSLEVVAGDRTLALGPPQQRLVLASLLVDAGALLTLDVLVDRVWGERPPDAARSALYAHVARIRRLVQPEAGLVRRSGGYLLEVDPDRVDLHRFRRLVDDGRAPGRPDAERAAVFREALKLYRGPALQGLGGPWAERVRTAWERRYLDAVVAWAQAETAAGDPGAVIGPLTDLLDQHPLVEPLAVALMGALHAAGRTAEALSCYATTRDRLIRELGTEPGADLRRMHQNVLRTEPATVSTTTAVPRQLPAAIRHFVGRAEEMVELDRLTAGLVVVAGTPGVGKTTLAVTWAHRIRRNFPDGQLHINLRGYAPTPPVRPAEALAQLLRALGVPAEQVPSEVDEAAGLYRSMLAEKRVLVLLDDAKDADQVRPLLPGGTGCLTVVTSRHRLTGLAVRDGAARLTLDTFSPDETFTLFERLVGTDRVRAEPAAAAELAALCAHLPLAVRITAANLANHPERQIADHVKALRATDLLAALTADGDERSTAVNVAFDLSYRGLTPAARRLFRAVGTVSTSDITGAAAAALLDASPAAADRSLEELANAHLLQETSPGRYTLHDLVRLHAAECARREDSTSDRRAVRDRLYRFYLDRVIAAALMLAPGSLRLPHHIPDPRPFDSHRAAMSWLDAERPNLVAVVLQAAEQDHSPVAWALADASRSYFYQRMYVSEWMTVARAGLATAQLADDLPAQAATHLNIADAYWRQGRNRPAKEHSTLALAAAERSGWPEAESVALNNLGNLLNGEGELTAAADCFERALAITTTNRTARGNQLGNLGEVYRELGDLDRAAGQFEAALALHREVGARQGEALDLSNLGETCRALGRLDEADRYLGQALELQREVGDRGGEAETLHRLAALRCSAGRPDDALDLADAAVTLAEEIGDRRSYAYAMNVTALARQHLGDHRAAGTAYRRALDVSRDIGERDPEIRALVGLATAFHHLGQRERAIGHAYRALALAQQAKYRLLEDQAHAVVEMCAVSGERDLK